MINRASRIYMSICIAGIYRNGEGAICVADKMSTYTSLAHEDIQAERPEVIKIFELTPIINILVAGSSDYAKELIRDVRQRIRPSHTLERMTENLINSYNKLRQKHAFYEVLFPQGFKSYREFNEWQLPFNDRVSYNRALISYDLKVDAIIVGKNSSNLYEILTFNHGSVVPCDEGFWAIGSGNWHAMRVLSQAYDKNHTKSQAEQFLRAAKKEAELDEHVGKNPPDVRYLN